MPPRPALSRYLCPFSVGPCSMQGRKPSILPRVFVLPVPQDGANIQNGRGGQDAGYNGERIRVLAFHTVREGFSKSAVEHWPDGLDIADLSSYTCVSNRASVFSHPFPI